MNEPQWIPPVYYTYWTNSYSYTYWYWGFWTVNVTPYQVTILITPGYFIAGSYWNDQNSLLEAQGILEIRSNPAETDGTFCWAGHLQAQTCGTSPCIIRLPNNGVAGTSQGYCPTSGTLTSGSTCALQCATGYIPIESVTGGGINVNCSDGILYQPICEVSPCVVQAPAFGTLGGCNSILQSGDSCQFSCLFGYNLTGSSTYCSFGTVYPQTCVPAPCTVIKDTDGFLSNCSDGTPFGAYGLSNVIPSQTDCQISCVSGYDVIGSKTSCRFGVLTEQQHCAPGSCIVNVPKNGTLGHCPGSLLSGQTCQISCTGGSAPTGQGQLLYVMDHNAHILSMVVHGISTLRRLVDGLLLVSIMVPGLN